jgi:hypothetical protein
MGFDPHSGHKLQSKVRLFPLSFLVNDKLVLNVWSCEVPSYAHNYHDGYSRMAADVQPKYSCLTSEQIASYEVNHNNHYGH